MTAAVRPGCNCAVDRAALDLSELPVLHRIAVFGIQRTVFFQVERTAIDLDHDEVILSKRAATDGQTGVLGNAVIAHAHQGRALHSNNAAVVRNAAALEEKPAVLNVNDIVGADAGVLHGILTHDGTGLLLAAVLDGDAALNGQRGLARHGAAVEGVTVQVKGQIIGGNGDVLPGIRQHRHGRISTGRVDSCLQGVVLDAVDLCDVGFLRFLDLVNGLKLASLVLLLHRDRFAGGLSDLSSFHLIQRGAGGAIGRKAVPRVRAAQRHIIRLRAVLDVQECLVLLGGFDCAVVYCYRARNALVGIGGLHVDIDALTGDVERAAFKGHGLGGIIPQSIVALRCIEGSVHKLRGLIAPVCSPALKSAVLHHGIVDPDEAAIVLVVDFEGHVFEGDGLTALKAAIAISLTFGVLVQVADGPHGIRAHALEGQRLLGRGVAVSGKLALAQRDGVTIAGRSDSRHQFLAGADHGGGHGHHRIPIILRVCGIVSVHRIGRISAALSTGGIIRRAAAAAASDLLVAGVTAVLAVSDLQVIGVTAAVAVVGHARSVFGDDRALGFVGVPHRSVRRRRQQGQHHYQRKQ